MKEIFEEIVLPGNDFKVYEGLCSNGEIGMVKGVILSYLASNNNPKVTNKELSFIVSKSIRTVIRHLNDLQDKGYISVEFKDLIDGPQRFVYTNNTKLNKAIYEASPNNDYVVVDEESHNESI